MLWIISKMFFYYLGPTAISISVMYDLNDHRAIKFSNNSYFFQIAVDFAMDKKKQYTVKYNLFVISKGLTVSLFQKY